MKELFYFSNSDVMVQVHYDDTENVLRYTSHRKISEREREIIEQYIKNHVVTEIEQKSLKETILNYGGIDSKLTYNLDQFHLERRKADKEKEEATNSAADSAVKDLISNSMENYYFEKIGETLIKIHKIEDTAESGKAKEAYHLDLLELVQAYNMYSNKKVDIQDLLN